MGQATSTDISKGPVYVTDGLTLSKIVIESRGTDDRRVISVDPDTQQLKFTKTKPLATFTQNEAIDEYPFLLNCSSSDTITVLFKLNQDLLSQFDDLNTNSFTVYSDILLRAYDDNYVTLKHTVLASKLVVNSSKDKSTMDPSVIQLSKDKDYFKVSVDLNTIPNEGKTYITFTGGSEEIFKALLFIEKDKISANPALLDANYRDAPYTFSNDSAEFRQTLSQLEERCHSFRSLLKTCIKKAQALDEATRHLALSRSGFSSSLSELSKHAKSIENPLMFDIIDDFIPVLTEKSTADIEESNVLTRNVITPLTLIYNSDIKLLSNKRRNFYDHAAAFYSTIGANRDSSNPDLLRSQVTFELERFDYFQYLNEFRNGHSIRNLIYNFVMYLENHNKERYSPSTNVNASKAEFYYKNFFKYKGSQQRMRNELAATTNINDLPSLNPASVLLKSTAPPLSTKSRDSSINISLFSSETGAKLQKSGVLLTLGGQNKTGWHKQLVTITDNLLTEFIDWRANHETLRCNPVDMTFSCIKTVDTLRDRKYCIEIITPSNIKRLFQAESEIERQSWVQMFTSSASLKADSNRFNRSKTASSPRDSIVKGKRISTLKFDLSIDDDISDNFGIPANIVSDVDLSNRLCCDCGSSNNVEWISLNLLVVVCIDCSGVHRSLGSHISKIRSLTLDTKAFESKEAQMLLYHVSNKFTNSYLEGSLPIEEKITPTASDRQRTLFITNKYVKKKFLLEEKSFNANESLIKAVHSANVPLVLKALAYGGNVKMVVIKDVQGEKKDVSLFEYSLTHCHGEPGEPVFDVSHLLQLNNAPVGDKVDPVLTLNEQQKKFWSSKLIAPSSTLAVTPTSLHSKKPSVSGKTSTGAESTKRGFPILISTSAESIAPSELQKNQGLNRSHSILLRRSSTFKSTNSDKRKTIDAPPDKSNRMSRFKKLSFRNN